MADSDCTYETGRRRFDGVVDEPGLFRAGMVVKITRWEDMKLGAPTSPLDGQG